jgi:hypothetical protein
MGEKGNGIAKFLKQRAVVVQLLGEMPLTQEEYDDFQDRADKLVARLTRLRDNAVIPETIFARFLDLQSVWAKRLAELIAAGQDDDDDEAENGDALNDPNLMIKA